MWLELLVVRAAQDREAHNTPGRGRFEPLEHGEASGTGDPRKAGHVSTARAALEQQLAVGPGLLIPLGRAREAASVGPAEYRAGCAEALPVADEPEARDQGAAGIRHLPWAGLVLQLLHGLDDADHAAAGPRLAA